MSDHHDHAHHHGDAHERDDAHHRDSVVVETVGEHPTPPGRVSLTRRLRPLVTLLGGQRRLIGLAILSGIAHQLVTLASAGTAALLVGRAITGSSASELRPLIVLLGVLVVPLAITPWLESYLAHAAAFRVLVDIRGRIYRAFERLAPAYMLERRSGDLGTAAIADVEQLEVFFAHTLSPLVVAATVPAAALVTLAVLHPLLAVVLLPIIVLLITVPARLRRAGERQGRELRAEVGELSAEVVDTLQGLQELVVFGARREQIGRIRSRSADLLRSKAAYGRRAAFEHVATEVITVVGLLAVVTSAAALVTSGHLDETLFPLAVVLAGVTFAPVLAVTDVARELNLVTAAAERVNAILDAPTPVPDDGTLRPTEPIRTTVEFDRVTFSYRHGLPEVLHDVDLTVDEGETVALVGHSGAGKSTCAHLLMRLWDVSGGAIRIGGHDIRNLPHADLRDLVTLIPQDVHLFNISIADNISLGRPDATPTDIERAARIAYADTFIRDLPDGYETTAGELGSRLSGGQRQRIAIARALLKNAPVLIMDEAVSSLDAASEHDVAAAMASATSGRTTIVIAHRLSTITSADRVVVLEAGRIVQAGHHLDLIQCNGPYRTLIASQLV